MEAIDLLQRVTSFLAPPPNLKTSEWADEYRRVASGPYPGKWSTARTPDLREVMDCDNDPLVKMIVIMKPTRIGGTEVVNNIIGRRIHLDPCNILYAQTALDEGRKYTEKIFMPMVESTPVLLGLVKRVVGSRASKTQTKLHKSFPGGDLNVVGSVSAKGFRMVDAVVAVGDDIDGWERNPEGDAVKLLIGRTKGIWNSKVILVSSPTTEGVSRIHNAFLDSDQRYRHVPCPHCDEFQILKFGGKDEDFGIKWNEDISDVWYVCEKCHEKIYEYQKDDMNTRGVWKAEAAFNGTAGFHLNPFVRSWHPWRDVVKEFLSSKNDHRKLMVFVNQWLGEVWKDDPGHNLDEDILYARRENYAAEVPRGVFFLTAAVDTQDHRMEVEVRGWGLGEESWIIDHKIIAGRFLEEKVQNILDDYLLRNWRHEDGAYMGLSRVCIDSGGHYPSQVYAFCKPREARGVYAVKGSNNLRADVLDGKIVHRKDAIYQMVGVTACKDILFGRLALSEAGPGYVHFPMHLDKEFFKQYFGEKLKVFKNTRVYDPVPGRRNESIDFHSYNLAACRLYNPDWEALRRRGVSGMDRTRLIYKHHNRLKHLDDTIVINPALPIIVCCDFGKNPLSWVLCQTDGKKVWVFDEVVLRNATTMDMAVEILKKYGKHGAGFKVYGSAVGTVRASTGKSEYAILSDMGLGRQVVKSTNPPDMDRINAVNTMLEDISGAVRLKYHSRCITLRKDFEQALWLEDMSDVDRTDFGRGNAVDALGYFINYEHPLRAVRVNPAKMFYK